MSYRGGNGAPHGGGGVDKLALKNQLLGSGHGAGWGRADQELDELMDSFVTGLERAPDQFDFGVCCVCDLSVIGSGNGTRALDRIYHIACFKCLKCQTALKGQSFYDFEQQPLCEPCYDKMLTKCDRCHNAIKGAILKVAGKAYHKECHACTECNGNLADVQHTFVKKLPYCMECFHRKAAERCNVCSNLILPDPRTGKIVRISASQRFYHIECYRCQDCAKVLTCPEEDRGCYPKNGRLLCWDCHQHYL